MGINKNFVKVINDYIVKEYKPTHIFLHLVNEKNLKTRLKNRLNNNRYDYFKSKFYNKVQKGFLKLLKNKKNVTIVDSNKSLKENKTIVINKINKLI